MNGATAEPCATTINNPRRSMMAMIGNSQNFFLTFKKAQSSEMRDMLFGFKVGNGFF